MHFLKDKRKRKLFISITSMVAVLAIIVTACAIYLGDYYHADRAAIEAFTPKNTVEPQLLEDNTIVLAPDGARTGFIFYPGGKVEYTAYLPLMEAMASEDILCVLVEMPFNLAVLDVNAADGIQEQYPQIDSWYIGGHSLGGSMAASYAADNADAFDGLVLLGAYSTADITSAGLDVLSIYGSEDHVLNRENYAEYRSNLPNGFTEFVIDGGCHAYFGMYGPQDGDGTPNITNEEQIAITAEAILDYLEENLKKDSIN